MTRAMLALLVLALASCNGELTPCQKAQAAAVAACAADSAGAICKEATAAAKLLCEASPAPPTTTTTTQPSPTPTVAPTPTATPEQTACPKKFTGDRVYMRNKPYGQGQDSSVWVSGDPEFCRLIHGVSVNSCHLEGAPHRVECEMELLGKTIGKAQACPEWEYRMVSDPTPRLCQNRAQYGIVTCDHFGSTAQRDDPQTPGVFEGTPQVCGEQRDGRGDPKAGFFMVAHFDQGHEGDVRACRPDHDDATCGPWVRVTEH